MRLQHLPPGPDHELQRAPRHPLRNGDRLQHLGPLLRRHFACATGINPALDRFGVRFGAELGAYSNHNRHVFDAPNFELRQLDPNVAVPFLNETNGSAIIGWALRMEACSPIVARHTAGAQDCEYELAWANTYQVAIQYTPTATRCGNAVYNRHRAPQSRLVRALAGVPNVRVAAFRQHAGVAARSASTRG